MLQLTHEELSRVQDLCRVLPRWKARQILQALARRASSAVSIMSSGRLDCPRRIGAERVVDAEDPGARLAASDAPPCHDGAPRYRRTTKLGVALALVTVFPCR